MDFNSIKKALKQCCQLWQSKMLMTQKRPKKIATCGLLNSALHESLFGQQFSKDKIPFLQEDLGGYFYVKPDSDPIAQICQGEDDFTCCFGMWQWASMAAMSIYTQVWPQVGDGREKKVKHCEEEGEPPDDDVRRPQMRGVTRRQRRHLSSKLGWPKFLRTNTLFEVKMFLMCDSYLNWLLS